MGKMFFPQFAMGRKKGIELKLNDSVLEHIKRLDGAEISSECGGRGKCGLDIIRIEKGGGSLSDLSDAEKKFIKQGKLKSGQRLACQAVVKDSSKDITVFVSDFGDYTILTDVIERDIELDPFVYRKENEVFYYPDKKIGDYSGHIFGLAVDIGTTTIVMQLMDLESGKNVGKPVAYKNPQIAFGNDIISRIGYSVNNRNGLKELQDYVISGINESIQKMEDSLGYKEGMLKDNIYDAVIVGNSTMRDIFFGINVKSLGFIPFEPHDKNPVNMAAGELGLNINDNALVYGPALIGGHAGADCLSDIIATRIYKYPDISMIIDIGTNGEIVIGNNKKMLTASCAAGGAYEGYQISCGVGAIAGAITEVMIDDGKISLKTIGDAPAKGTCGSGVIDLLAELLKNDIMNDRARISEDFHLGNGIYLTQDDINQLIIAKAGLRTDQDLLIKYYGVNLDDIKHVYLAGAFGNFMNVENAMAIGLLPRVDRKKFIRFGNGALAGAIDMLLSRKIRREAEQLTDMITHTKPNEIEKEEFQYMVADNMYFNKT